MDDNCTMPRISAPSVAEHRAQQRGALVAAARSILLESGLAAVTPSAVATHAGLARSSFYEYFPSAIALITEVALDDARAWAAELGEKVASSDEDRLAVYIRAAVTMVAEGKHAIADALAGVVYPDELRAGIDELHAELAAPLFAAIRDLDLPQPRLQAMLVQGVIESAMRRVSAGDDPVVVADAAIDLVTRGLRPGVAPRPPTYHQ
jgi:AcrR family transcriptional regulator